jgi:O-antigen/teichoic acid export membrane protein
VSSNGLQVGLGWFSAGALGLVVSSVVADALAGLSLLRAVLPDLRAFRDSVRPAQLWTLMKEYHDFPLYAASQNVINALSLGLPVLLLTEFYGLPAAGAYAFAMRLIGAPMGIVLAALRQVLFQKASETRHRGGSLVSLFRKTTIGLFAQAILPTIVLVVWGPRLFATIFGREWVVAGEFARSLAVWLLFGFCNLPALLVARLIRIQRTVFLLDMATLAARFSTLFIGGYFLSAVNTGAVFSIVGALMNLSLILLVHRALVRAELQPAPSDAGA